MVGLLEEKEKGLESLMQVRTFLCTTPDMQPGRQVGLKVAGLGPHEEEKGGVGVGVGVEVGGANAYARCVVIPENGTLCVLYSTV